MNKAQADLGEMSTSIGFETNVRASDEKTCLVKPKNEKQAEPLGLYKFKEETMSLSRQRFDPDQPCKCGHP